MKSYTLLISLMLLASLTACQTTGSDPSPATIPSGTEMVEPADDVPEEYAAFFGVWSGKWDDVLDGKLAVRKVDPEGKVSVVYAWGDHPRGNFSSGSVTERAEIVNGVLTVRVGSRGAVATFEMRDDGSLKATWSRGGDPSHARFVRL